MDQSANFTIYAVRNREGLWFRAKGYGGGGNSWVNDIARARLYVKLAPARGCVSFFASKHPQFGVPTIVTFMATETGLLDESDRVAAKAKKKHDAEAKREAYRVSEERDQDKRELERLKKKLGA